MTHLLFKKNENNIRKICKKYNRTFTVKISMEKFSRKVKIKTKKL